jgi:hypothetical protein
MGGDLVRMEQRRNAYRILVVQTEEKKHSGLLTCAWEHIIYMGLAWFLLAQNSI